MNSIIAKNGYSLFIASIVILFTPCPTRITFIRVCMHSIPLMQLLHSTLQLLQVMTLLHSTQKTLLIEKNHPGNIDYCYNAQAQMKTGSDEHGVSSNNQGNLSVLVFAAMLGDKALEDI
jgi:hypothetical protein